MVYVCLCCVLLLSSAYAQNQPTTSSSTPRPRVRLPVFAFESYHENPLLGPQGESWEAQAVSTPAAIMKQDTLFLLYTAQDRAHFGIWNGTSRLGLAFSTDGLNFTRSTEPILTPTWDVETPGGCKEPRVVFADNIYYLTYSAFDAKTSRLALATSSDLRHWKKHGLVFPDTGATSAGAMLPQKINGRYVMYYGKQELRIAYSNDLVHWFPQAEPVLRARAGKFDSARLEPGPPPVIIDSTIVLLYHGEDAGGQRALGLVRFSMDDPTVVLARWDDALFAPPPESGSAQTFKATGLVGSRGQYELFYTSSANHISRVKGRLLFTEGK